MSRRQKRRSRPGGGGFGKQQARAAQADHRLVKLLETSLALPDGEIVQIPGTTSYAVSDDCWLVALAIRERCKELGGVQQDHIERALQTILQGGAPHGRH